LEVGYEKNPLDINDWLSGCVAGTDFELGYWMQPK
jgi:hypothetical protein